MTCDAECRSFNTSSSAFVGNVAASISSCVAPPALASASSWDCSLALAPADVLSTREALPEGDDVLGVLDDEEKVVAYLDGLLETVGDDCGPPRGDDDTGVEC